MAQTGKEAKPARYDAPEAVKYPGVPSASILMYAYPVCELDQAVPAPPTSAEHP